jgi:hypothetical protein
MPPQRAPDEPGDIRGRHLDIDDPEVDAKSAGSISAWDQGFWVTMQAACWEESSSKIPPPLQPVVRPNPSIDPNNDLWP